MIDPSQRRPAPDPHGTAACSHVVQFYDEPWFLHQSASVFLAEGIRQREPVIVIATRANRDAMAGCLATEGFDLPALEHAGLYRAFDAGELLATFMSGPAPDPSLFYRSVGAVVTAAQQANPRAGIRAYGEMVDLLLRQGNTDGALELEGLWNSLGATNTFSLMCGYSMGVFADETRSAPFEEVCRQHTQVRPAEGFARTGDEDLRMREIAVLQQRARALEAEVAHRRELEIALRRALGERDDAERERERLLEMERSARTEAESAGRVKDEFLALLSHELRTPLNAIMGWAHIANKPGTDDRTIRRALEVIQRNASVQLHLTDDLLDISRILTGKLIVKCDQVHVPDVLRAAIDTVRPAALAKNIHIQADVDEGVPAIRGDAGRLQQVMWNLLSNALKFTPAYGHVSVRVVPLAGHISIAVADTGEGITPAFMPHVFERFRQADTSTTRCHSGLGLGLSVVRYLVEAHGGRVAVSSDGQGRGSTFTVTLPTATTLPS